MFKKSKFLVSLTLAFTLLVSSNVVATPNQPIDPGVNGIEVALTHTNAKPLITDPAKLKEHKKTIQEGIDKSYKENHSWVAVDNYLKSQGIEVVIPHGIAAQDSSNSDVTVYKPSVAWDQWAGEYIIDGRWQWKKDSSGIPLWHYDFNIASNVGGNDAAGLWWDNTNVRLQTYIMYTYDYKKNSGDYTSSAWAWNQYGVTLKAQDQGWGDYSVPGATNYDWDSGSVQAWVTFAGSTGQRTYLQTNLAHDWNAAVISGVGINATGMSFNFTDSTKGWPAASQPLEWFW